MPPPTTTTGIGSALVFMRSTVSAIRSSIRASALLCVDPGHAAGSPMSASPAATARSVVVSVSPPKTSARRGQLVADALRPDLGTVDVRAAADPDREHVGHAEVRAHAADLDRDRRLARKAVLEHADVGGRAADVDHRAVGRARRGRPRRASSWSARRRRSPPGSARRSRRSSACRRSGSGRRARRCASSRERGVGRRRRCSSASSRRQAFMIVAFSRSSRPIRPISCDRRECDAGQLLARSRPRPRALPRR